MHGIAGNVDGHEPARPVNPLTPLSPDHLIVRGGCQRPCVSRTAWPLPGPSPPPGSRSRSGHRGPGDQAAGPRRLRPGCPWWTCSRVDADGPPPSRRRRPHRTVNRASASAGSGCTMGQGQRCRSTEAGEPQAAGRRCPGRPGRPAHAATPDRSRRTEGHPVDPGTRSRVHVARRPGVAMGDWPGRRRVPITSQRRASPPPSRQVTGRGGGGLPGRGVLAGQEVRCRLTQPDRRHVVQAASRSNTRNDP